MPLFFATAIYTIFLVAMQPLYEAGRVPVINPTPMLYGVALILTPRWHRLWVFPSVIAATFLSEWNMEGNVDYISIVGTSLSRAAGILIFVIFLDMLLRSGIDVRRPRHVVALAIAMIASLAVRSYLLPFVVPDSVTAGTSVVSRFIDAFVPNTPKALVATTLGQAAGLLGMVAFAPPMLLLATSQWRWPSMREGLQTLSIGVLIVFLVWFVFNQPNGSLLFLITVAVVVVTFSSGFLSASLTVLAIGFAALGVQLNNLRLGVFSVLDVETLTVQCFLAATTLVTLLVGAALEQRKLFQTQSELDRRAAEQAAAVKTRFLATMSHEIRSPLASLALLTSALRTSISADDERAESIRIIDSIGHHVLSLLNGVLNYTRFEAVGHVLNRRPTNVSLLVENVVATLVVQAQEREIELEVNVSAAPFDVTIDSERVSQVLINLVGNGLQHAQTRVSVSAEFMGNPFDRLRVTVMDDGSGIPDGAQEHIFEPYFRAEGETRTGRVGLGLAICKEIVTLMDGTIGLDIGAGHGTAFWFEIPSPRFVGSDGQVWKS
ncbi:signal transduction histidine kinase [Rhizobium sp. BK251]|nr:signal transduction histidine kinase [Rhizobium sp. BK251]